MEFSYKNSLKSAIRYSFYWLAGLFVGAAHFTGLAQPTINGQYQESRHDLSPMQPSPKVAKLGLYGDIPVDNYTGVPDIKIPLYTYSHNGLEVPIYLSYHSTGLLVDERATEVGLGWSLHAGGVIGHTVYGSNDEYYNGFGHGVKVPLPELASQGELSNFLRFASTNHQIDAEPDVYNFSYGDQSGRYVTDYLGTPHTVPFKDIKIDGPENIITDEQGIRYVYAGKNERTQTIYGSYCVQPSPNDIGVNSRRNFISARYLTQIISPTKDTIRLDYTPDTVSYYNPIDYTLTRVLSAAGCKEQIINYNTIPGSTRCVNTTQHFGYKISAITSRNGVTVRFFYERAQRLDCLGGHRLQAIEVTGGTLAKRYDFYHGYFQSAPIPSTSDALDKAATYRLRLDSVRERGLPAYKFSYHKAAGYAFPAVGSFSQDLMGYYNGQPNNALVAATMFDIKSPLIEPTPVPGVNRMIDTAAVKLGMLERITYPTNGYTQFAYEANEYLVDKHFMVDSSKLLTHFEVSINDELYAGNQHTVRQKFRFAAPARVLMQCHLLLPIPFGVSSGQTSAFYVLLQDSASGRVVYAMPPGLRDDAIVAIPPGTYTVTAATSDTGLREVLLEVDMLQLYQKDIYIKNYPFYGCRIKSVTSSGRTAYGQDVQKVYSYQKNASQNQSSGYVLYTPQLKYNKEHWERDISAPFPNTAVTITKTYVCDYAVLSQSPINPVGSIHGGNIAYSQVQVSQKSLQNTGRTDYLYSNTLDFSPHALEYPFPPPTSYDWQRGQLLRQTSFVSRDGKYIPVSTIRNTYSSYYDPTLLYAHDGDPITADLYHPAASLYHLTIIPACRAITFAEPVNNIYGDILGLHLGYFYHYVSAFNYLQQVDETFYGLAGDSLTTHKRYAYSSPLHTQPTLLKSWGNVGDTLLNRRTYPEDYSIGPLVSNDNRVRGIQGLRQYHIKTAVIESRNTIVHPDGTQQAIAGHLAEYQLYNQVPLLFRDWEWQSAPPTTLQPLVVTNNQWQPDTHYLLKNDISYQPDYSMLAIKPRAGQQTVLLRSRDKEIVVQAVNTAVSQLAATSFEPDATGRWRYDSLGTHCVSTAARTGRWAYRLDGQGPVSRGQLPAGDYELSAWAQSTAAPSLTLTAGQVLSSWQATATAPGGWTQFRTQLRFTGAGRISLDAATAKLIDELRLSPVGSQLTTFTHEPLVGMTSQTDPSGRTTTYEYDALGRLLRVRDERGRILTQQQYHYGRP